MKDTMLQNTIRFLFFTTVTAATIGYTIGGIWLLWSYVTTP